MGIVPEWRGVWLSAALPHQYVAELPGVRGVDVLREQARPVGQRRPVGVKTLSKSKRQ